MLCVHACVHSCVCVRRTTLQARRVLCAETLDALLPGGEVPDYVALWLDDKHHEIDNLGAMKDQASAPGLPQHAVVRGVLYPRLLQ